jgi:hypothetical protein
MPQSQPIADDASSFQHFLYQFHAAMSAYLDLKEWITNMFVFHAATAAYRVNRGLAHRSTGFHAAIAAYRN